MRPSVPALIVLLLAAAIAFGGAPADGPRQGVRRHVAPRRKAAAPKYQKPGHAARKAGQAGRRNGARLAPIRPLMGVACARPQDSDPQVCPCGSSCPCDPACWCHGSHGGASGSTSGATGGGTPTSGTTAGTTAGASGSTAGTTSGTTSATAGSTAGATSGATSGTTSGPGPTGGSDGTTASTGGSGESTGGTAGTTAGGTGGTPGWTPTGTIEVADATNGFVSGTNVNVTFTLNLKKTGDSSLNDVFLRSVDLKIGGVDDSLFNHGVKKTLTGVNGEFTYSVRVRFASTRFLDDKKVALNAKFYYTLSNPDGGYQEQDFAVPTTTVTTYNKGLALATQLVASCPPNPGYFIGTDSPDDYYDADSQKAILSNPAKTGAIDRLGSGAGGMNHSVIGGPFLGKPDILTRLKSMTTFLAFTHGEVDYFLPSFGTGAGQSIVATDRLFYGSTNGYDSEVGKATLGEPNSPNNPIRKVPKPNMVVLHSCSGLASGSSPFLRSFGLIGALDSSDPSGWDRAGAGFFHTVDARLIDPTKGRLSDHAKRLYENLAKGLTIQQALLDANLALPPARTGCPPFTRTQMSMQWKGDPDARLISVYTGHSSVLAHDAPPDRPANEQVPRGYPYRWYLVNP